MYHLFLGEVPVYVCIKCKEKGHMPLLKRLLIFGLEPHVYSRAQYHRMMCLNSQKRDYSPLRMIKCSRG